MIIDERLEELACLYVVGALDGPELREFEAALQANPALQKFVAGLHPSVEAVSGAIPLSLPPPELRARILARIEPQKVLALPDRPAPAALWLWRALTAGMAALCLFLLASDRQLRQDLASQTRKVVELNQVAQFLQDATNSLSQTIAAQNRELVELKQVAQALQAATNDLSLAVAALRETNRLASLRITMLNSLLADAPKTVAVTLWDNQSAAGEFVVQNLRALPANEDYELWVMDEHKVPVAAGVFHTDESGTLRMDFHPSRFIKTPGQFCVTEEVKGGAAEPTLKNLVLASN